MSDATSISDFALAALITYGPLALGLTLLLGAAGAPFPGSLVLVAAGAFARQGFIDWRFAFAAAVIGVVVGDSIGYFIGRLGGVWAERRMARMSAWQTATNEFARRGGMAIFLTRFLITPLGIPVTLIAGMSAYAYERFLVTDFAGEVLWVALYGGIGFALGSQWQVASQFITDFSGLILGVALLIVGIVLGVRYGWRKPAARQPARTPEPAHQPAPESQPAD